MSDEQEQIPTSASRITESVITWLLTAFILGISYFALTANTKLSVLSIEDKHIKRMLEAEDKYIKQDIAQSQKEIKELQSKLYSLEQKVFKLDFNSNSK